MGERNKSLKTVIMAKKKESLENAPSKKYKKKSGTKRGNAVPKVEKN